MPVTGVGIPMTPPNQDPLPIEQGGTAARTAPEARRNLDVPGLSDPNNWTGSPNTFDGDVVVNGATEHNDDLIVNVTPSDLNRIVFNDTSNGRQLVLVLESALLASNQIDLPYNQSGRLALWPNSAARGALLYRSNSAALPSGQLPIGAAGQFLKAGTNDPEWGGLSAVAVNLSAQAADITTTNLVTSASGMYRVSVYLETTTADAAAGTLAVTLGWTDRVGATTSVPISGHSLAATGRDFDHIEIRANSGNITYAVAVTGIYGTSQYAITVRVEAI